MEGWKIGRLEDWARTAEFTLPSFLTNLFPRRSSALRALRSRRDRDGERCVIQHAAQRQHSESARQRQRRRRKRPERGRADRRAVG